MKRNDLLWKAALEDLMEDFLLFFYPSARKQFNFKKDPEYLDKELDQLFPPVDDKYAPRYVDKLVKVFTNSNSEEWVLIHIEVQGYADKDFAKRMFQYYYRILDKYDKPITAFAIFVDANNNFHPVQYKRSFLGTKVNYTFKTCKIADLDDAKLEASNNPFATVILSAKLAISKRAKNDEQLFDLAFDLAKRLLRKKLSKEKISHVMSFLRYYIRFEKQEMFAKFENEVFILTERSTTMGIEELLLDRAKKEGKKEGEKKGLEEGIELGYKKLNIETALKLLQNGMSIDFVANITGLSIEEIKKLA
jgi:predicted transposase/invertase (TIGR01784 family)